RYVYCLCPDINAPCGGVRKIYTLVDILREIGLEAFVLHLEWGFKCDWFDSKAPVIYMSSPFDGPSGLDENREIYSLPAFGGEDLLVIPEIFVPQVVPSLAIWNMQGIIFNQNVFQTFNRAAFPTIPFSADRNKEAMSQLYLNERILGALV